MHALAEGHSSGDIISQGFREAADIFLWICPLPLLPLLYPSDA